MDGIPEAEITPKRKRANPAKKPRARRDAAPGLSESDNEPGPSRRRKQRKAPPPEPSSEGSDHASDSDGEGPSAQDHRLQQRARQTDHIEREAPIRRGTPGLNMHPFEKNIGEYLPHQVIVLQACKEAVSKFPVECNNFFWEEMGASRANVFRKLLALFLITAHFRVAGIPRDPRKSNEKKGKETNDPTNPPKKNEDDDCFTDTLEYGMPRIVQHNYMEDAEGRIVSHTYDTYATAKTASYPTIAVKFEMLLNSSGVPCTYRVWFEVFDTSINFNEAIVRMIARIRKNKVPLPAELKNLRKYVEDITSINAFLDLCRNYFVDADNLRRLEQAMANSTGITTATSPVAPTQMFSFASAVAQSKGVCHLQNNHVSYVPENFPTGWPVSMAIAPLPCLSHAIGAANLLPAKIQSMRPPFSMYGDMLLKKYAVRRMDDAEFVVQQDVALFLQVVNMVGARVISEDEMMRFTSNAGPEIGSKIMHSMRLRTEGYHYFLRAMRIRGKNYEQYMQLMRDLRNGTAEIVQDVLMNYTGMKDAMPRAEYYAIQHIKTTHEPFVWNIGPKPGADVSLESNYLSLLRGHFRRACKIVPGPTEISVLAHWLSSLRVHILPFDDAFAFNILSADQQETGKSFAHEQVVKMSVPGTTMEAQNVTNKAWAGTGFELNKMIIVTDEANPELVQPERPGATLNEFLAMVKSILTKGSITTAMMYIDENGNRITKVVTMDMKCTFWFGMNGWIPTEKTPLLSRFWLFGFPQSFPKIATVDEYKNTLECDENPAEVDNFMRHMHDVHALVIFVGFLIDAGRIRPISRDILSIVMPELSEALKQAQFPALGRRFKDNMASAAIAVCIATSVIMLLDPDFWTGITRPNFESNPALFFECLEQLMYLRREHVVFAMTLMSESIGEQRVQTVLSVVKDFRADCINKKNGIIGDRMRAVKTTQNNVTTTTMEKDRRYFTVECSDVPSLAKKLRAWMDLPENAKYNSETFLTEHNIISALNHLQADERTVRGAASVPANLPDDISVVGDQREETCPVLVFGHPNGDKGIVNAAFLLEAVEQADQKNTVEWMTNFLKKTFSRAFTKRSTLLTAFSMRTHIPGTMRHYDAIEIREDPTKPTYFTSRVGDLPWVRLVDCDLNEALHAQHAHNIGVPVNWDLFPGNAAARVQHSFTKYADGVLATEMEFQRIAESIQKMKEKGAHSETLAKMRSENSEFLYSQGGASNPQTAAHRRVSQAESADIVRAKLLSSRLEILSGL